MHNEDKGDSINSPWEITGEKQEQAEEVPGKTPADRVTDGFISKKEKPEEVQTSARRIKDIEDCMQILLDAGLTKRETEVALLVLKCMSNAEIAEELFISETTVKKHMSNIFAKLGINKREQIRNVFH